MAMVGGAAQYTAARTVRPITRATAPLRRRSGTVATPALPNADESDGHVAPPRRSTPAATARPPFGAPSTTFLAQALALKAGDRPIAMAAERRAAIAAYHAQIGEYAHILGPVRPFAFTV